MKVIKNFRDPKSFFGMGKRLIGKPCCFGGRRSTSKFLAKSPRLKSWAKVSEFGKDQGGLQWRCIGKCPDNVSVKGGRYKEFGKVGLLNQY